ncbi:MAG TPA: BACON domain-containing carbohydrate-binding protein [Lentimicrobium sp.]|nr:BACON domain-containing carbohydrate-binding protein [Lentimicrobium sp.]
MKFRNLLIPLLVLIAFSVKSQDLPQNPSFTGTGTLMGISKPLRDIQPITAEEMAVMQEKADLKLLNPKLRYRDYPYAATALPKGPDPVWQKESGTRSVATTPTVYNGQNSPYYPPDENGTIGPNHYMQTVNTTYAIYNKSDGVKVAGPTAMNQLFGTVPGSSCNDGDPIILYDERADRWMAAEFSLCGSPDRMLIAVSTTDDPTGTWYQYSFVMNGMPDYEKFGIWSDGYYMATNTTSGTDIYVFEREVMLNGGTSPKMVSFDNANRPGSVDGFMMVPPVDCDGETAPPSGEPGLFIAHQDDAFGGSADQLWIYELDVDWVTTTNSTFTRVQQLDVQPYDCNFGNNWNNIKQPGTSQELDAVPQVIMNVPQYRNWGAYESIVCCHTVDVDNTDHAGIRWYELRRTSGSDWTVRQQGTYAPDEHSRWMGSIMMNGSNELAIGYSISSSTEYPGIRVTGQSQEEYEAASGIMDEPEGIIHTGTASQNGANRWGDYSLLSVDPVNDETFWYTNQYESGGRKTKFASFNIGPLGPAISYVADNTLPCLNETVYFTDNSTGDPISWLWTFSPNTVTFVNGTSATSQNPEVQFNAYGNYDVTLQATNAAGTTELTLPEYISVNEVNVDFSASNTTVVINNPVTFSDLSSCEIRSYLWNFGADATPATANTPGPHQVIYSTTGPKTITLTINGTVTETKTDYINVIDDFFIMNTSTITTCTGTFVDPGGNFNYNNNQNFTTTFYPSSNGQVSANFTAFDLEASASCANDYLLIYNGRNSLSPLIGKFCGTDNPGTVTASNTYGALTFIFHSNSSITSSGWSADLSCVSAVLNPDELNAITYTDTRIDLDWILNTSNDNVMLVWSADNSFGTPATGTVYSTGELIPGGGTVLYSGNETAFSHTSLSPGTIYYYKIYSMNSSNEYSAGLTASATTLTSPPVLNINPDNLEASYEAGSSNFNITTNTSWTAVCAEEWVTITGSGSGNGLLTVNYTENTIAVPRTATITVSVLALDPVTVTLVQAGAPAFIELSPLTFDVDIAAGTADIEVNSNAPWTASSDASWCVPTASGMGDGIITLQYEENTRAEIRTANISVDVEGLGTTLVTLTQAAAQAVLAIEPPLAEVSNQAGSVDFNVTANFNWVSTTDASWVTIPANGTGDLIMNATYTENMLFEPRSATITISGNGLEQIASIIQAAGEPVVYVSPETVEVGYLAGTTNLTVTSNSDWTVTEEADWMTVTNSGTGNGTITVDYIENPIYEDRTAVITVSVGSGTPAVINFTQHASEVGIPENDQDGIRIYPNPAKSLFVIEANASLYPEMDVRLTDPAGATVLSETCKGKDRYTFDIKDLSAGTYTLNIKSNEKSISRKVVIIK